MITLVGAEFTKTKFPGGESCIRVAAVYDELVTVHLDFESNEDLFDMALIVDAIRRERSDVNIQLFMPYVPYARQDRVCNPGESLSIKVLADFVNGLYFSSVCIVDPHSDVTPALFNSRLLVVNSYKFAPTIRQNVGTAIIVAPDAGAAKKAQKFAEKGGFPAVVQAEKVRELSTGKILSTKVHSEHVGDTDFLIVDDICDGGRTFVELAKELRKLTTGKIKLFVTHGVFSAGTEVFDNLIDEVYTVNPVGATGRAAVASGEVIRI